MLNDVLANGQVASLDRLLLLVLGAHHPLEELSACVRIRRSLGNGGDKRTKVCSLTHTWRHPNLLGRALLEGLPDAEPVLAHRHLAVLDHLVAVVVLRP